MEQGNVIRLYGEDGLETVHTPMSVGAMVRKIAQLEQRIEGLEGGLRKLSDPMAYEGIPIFHGTKQPWNIAKQALAQQE